MGGALEIRQSVLNVLKWWEDCSCVQRARLEEKNETLEQLQLETERMYPKPYWFVSLSSLKLAQRSKRVWISRVLREGKS